MTRIQRNCHKPLRDAVRPGVDRRDRSKPPQCPVLGYSREGQPLDWISHGLITRIWVTLDAAEDLERMDPRDVPADSAELLRIVRTEMQRAHESRRKHQSHIDGLTDGE